MFPPPKLIAITAAAARGLDETLEATGRLCRMAQPGAVAVQVREPEWSGAELVALADRLRVLTRLHQQRLLLNDRLDVAWMCQADGVHLGERSVSTAHARALFTRREPRMWISRAWHRIDVAPDDPVDAWVLSPVVEARKGAPAVGSAGLARFVRQLQAVRPRALQAQGRSPEADALGSDSPLVYALGGVQSAAVPECLAAGATGVAAIGAVYDHPEALLQALGVLRR